jgi:hypothetical protein
MLKLCLACLCAGLLSAVVISLPARYPTPVPLTQGTVAVP